MGPINSWSPIRRLFECVGYLFFWGWASRFRLVLASEAAFLPYSWCLHSCIYVYVYVYAYVYAYAYVYVYVDVYVYVYVYAYAFVHVHVQVNSATVRRPTAPLRTDWCEALSAHWADFLLISWSARSSLPSDISSSKLCWIAPPVSTNTLRVIRSGLERDLESIQNFKQNSRTDRFLLKFGNVGS